MKKYQFISFIMAVVTMISLLSPFTMAANVTDYPNTYTNTGNYRKDIIGVAATQLGYREGSGNDTKYGDWYGLPNNPWCAMFVSWCADQAEIPTSILKKSSIASPAASYFNIDYYGASEYMPIAGDLFFTKNFSHVGLVYYVEGDYFYSLEGNSNSSGSSDGEGVVSIKRKISNYYYGVPKYGEGHTLTLRYHANGATVKNADRTYDRYKVLSTDGINMRADAGTSHRVVSALPMNTTFTVTETKTANGYTWGKTTYNGYKGWCVISMGWTKKIGSVPMAPYYTDTNGLIYETSSAKPKTLRLLEGTSDPQAFPSAAEFGLERKGYTFAGWMTATVGGNFFPTGNTAKAEAIKGEKLNGNSTLTLYAVWMPDSVGIRYHANGGSNSSDTYRIDSNLLYKADATLPYQQKWSVGETKANGLVNISTFGLFKRGYTFVGWGTAPSGGIVYDQNLQLSSERLYAEIFNGKTVVTLYAIWSPNTLSVQYHANGGKISSNTYAAKEDGIYVTATNTLRQQIWTYNLPQTNGLVNASTFSLTRTGYTFIGWSTAKSGGTVLNMDNAELLPTEIDPKLRYGSRTVTLYAVWVDSAHIHQYKTYYYNDDATAEKEGTETAACSCGATHTRVKNGTKLKKSSTLFHDIPTDAWYGQYFDYAVTHALLAGNGNGQMQPIKEMTRAEFVQLLANLSGADLSAQRAETSFSDVSAEDWYAPAVKWASANGIVSGNSDGTFAPSKAITREQICSLIVRYAREQLQITLPQNADNDLFTDDEEIASWAKADVYICKRAEIISGINENEFAPKNVATKAAVATLISRFHANYMN